MYKYGVAHCCCNCVILGYEEMHNRTGFEQYNEQLSGSTTPTFNNSTCTFNGIAYYKLLLNSVPASTGILINPIGTVSSLSYIYEQYNSNDTLQHTWKVQYLGGGDGQIEPGEEFNRSSSGSDWSVVRIYCDNSLVYTTKLLCQGWRYYNGTTWIMKSGTMLKFWTDIQNNSDNPELFMYQATIGANDYFKIKWRVEGSNYNLAISQYENRGYVSLWDPTGADECEKPDDCSYLVGNLSQDYPGIKATFQSVNDYEYSGSLKTLVTSRLNGLYMYGLIKDKCRLKLTDTRWVCDTIPSSCSTWGLIEPEKSATCSYENYIDVEEYGSSIKLTFHAYIQYYNSTYQIWQGVTQNWTGYAPKDNNGQIDLSEDIELEWDATVYQADIDAFEDSKIIVSGSNHTEAHNPVIYGFLPNSTTTDTDSFTITWQLGFVGFNTTEKYPNSYLDFTPKLPAVTFILTADTSDLTCSHAPTIFRSPSITECGKWKGVYCYIDIREGFARLWTESSCQDFDGTCSSTCSDGSTSGYTHCDECGVYYNDSQPGTAVGSPRGTTDLCGTNDWGVTWVPLAQVNSVNIQAGNRWQETWNMGTSLYSGKFFRDTQAGEGYNQQECIAPFSGIGTQTISGVQVQSAYPYCVKLNEWGYPISDPDTFQTLKWYGAVPVSLGSISLEQDE